MDTQYIDINFRNFDFNNFKTMLDHNKTIFNMWQDNSSSFVPSIIHVNVYTDGLSGTDNVQLVFNFSLCMLQQLHADMFKRLGIFAFKCCMSVTLVG